MKNKLALSLMALMAVFMTSCMSQYPPFSQTSYYMDYSAYAKSGFFITESMSCSVDYESVGSMEIVERSGRSKAESKSQPEKKVSLRSNGSEDDIYGNAGKSHDEVKLSKNYRYADPESALACFVSEARKAGANGVLGLRFQQFYDSQDGKSGPLSWRVSGMLIKKSIKK